jgi:putative hydrolase of the HAD superfamily
VSNNKLKAIIFDVDGVIFQNRDEHGHYVWSRTIKEDLGITREHFDVIYCEDVEVIRGHQMKREHLTKLFNNHPLFSNITCSVEDYITYWLTHDKGVDFSMLDLVQKVNTQIPCYLGTNQEALRTEHILKHVGSHFRGCFASYKIGVIKPEQGFFQHIEKALSLLPHELLLIDDTKNNTLGAQDCGWHVYHYQNDIEGLMDFFKKYEVMNG